MTRTGHRQVLKRIRQVQETRCRIAEKHYREQLAVCEALREEIAGHRRAISAHDAQLDALAESRDTASPCTDPDSLARPLAYRYWLVFDLEREQYYLEETLGRFTEEEQTLADCRQRWMQVKARAEGMQTSIDSQQRRDAAAQELIDESDWEDLPSIAGGCNG